MAEHKILNTNRMPVRSLVWSGDELIDWVAGGARYGLDGSVRRAGVNYAYRFDAAVATTDGKFAVIYERTGTKGLVLQEGNILREINRSFYQAHVYEYPICLWTREDGRSLMAHCPESRNHIEIDDLMTGERVTKTREPSQSMLFHSRLKVNPRGNRILSAGWLWHPMDCVRYMEIPDVESDSGCLDKALGRDIVVEHMGHVDECAACWQTNERLIISAGGVREVEDDDDPADMPPEQAKGIIVFDVTSNECVSLARLEQPAGTVMPVGEDRVATFYGYPRLVSLSDGKVLQEWPDIPSGTQVSSIIRDYRPPPMAFDPANRRFAVAEGDKIHVVML